MQERQIEAAHDSCNEVIAKNKNYIKERLKERIPTDYVLGAAKSGEDSFFSVVAQNINQLWGKDYTIKSLRLICEQAVKSNRYPSIISKIRAAEGSEAAYQNYLARIAFTVEEIEGLEKQKLLRGPATLGRPELEGIILCNELKIRLHIIELYNSQQEVDKKNENIAETIIDANGVYHIEVIEKYYYNAQDIIHILIYQNYFIPLMQVPAYTNKRNKIKKVNISSSQESLVYKRPDKGKEKLDSSIGEDPEEGNISCSQSNWDYTISRMPTFETEYIEDDSDIMQEEIQFVRQLRNKKQELLRTLKEILEKVISDEKLDIGGSLAEKLANLKDFARIINEFNVEKINSYPEMLNAVKNFQSNILSNMQVGNYASVKIGDIHTVLQQFVNFLQLSKMDVLELKTPLVIADTVKVNGPIGVIQTEKVILTNYEPIVGEYKLTSEQTPRLIFPYPEHRAKFIPRPHLWKRLLETLRTDQEAVLCYLAGMGGVGKTELLIEVAQQAKKGNLGRDYFAIVWFPSQDRNMLEQLFRQRAKEISSILRDKLQDRYFPFDQDYNFINAPLQDVNQKFYHMLETYSDKTNGNWLFLFDDTKREIIEQFLPSIARDNGHILFSSRETKWSQLRYQKIEVDVFEPNEAKRFLHERISKSDIKDQTLEELAKQLGFLPVALEQTASIVKKIGLNKFLKKWKNNKLEFLSTSADHLDKHSEDLLTALAVCRTSLEVAIENCKEAEDIFKVCAYFDNHHIPEFIFKKRWVKDIAKRSLSALEQVSLIKRDRMKKCFSIHPLMQEITWLTISYSDSSTFLPMLMREQDEIYYHPTSAELSHAQCIHLEQVLDLLYQACRYDRDKLNSIAEMETLLPHLQKVFDYHIKLVNSRHSFSSSTMRQIIKIGWKMGYYHFHETENHLFAKRYIELALCYARRENENMNYEEAKLLLLYIINSYSSGIKENVCACYLNIAKSYFDNSSLTQISDKAMLSFVEGIILEKESSHRAMAYYEIATAYLDNCDQDMPLIERVIILNNMGNIFKVRNLPGDIEKALTCYKNAWEELKKIYGKWYYKTKYSGFLLHSLLQVYEAIGNEEGKKCCLEELSKIAENRSDAIGYRWSTLLALNDGNPKEALKWSNKIEELQKTKIEDWINKADIYRRLNDYSEAHKILQQISHKQHLSSLERAAINHMHGKIYENEGKIKDAVESYKKANMDSSENFCQPSKLGNLLRKLKDYEECHKILDEALLETPQDPLLLFEKGLAFYEEKKYEEALRYFEYAIDKQPDNSSYLASKGAALYYSKQYKAAHAVLNQALEIDSNNDYASYTQGRVYANQKQYQLALSCFERANEIKPIKASYLRNMANILRYLTRYREAHKALDKVLAINSRDVYALNIKGLLYRDEKKWESALICFQKARTINPKNTYYWAHEGNVFRMLKRHPEAHGALDRAIEMDRNCAYALFSKGQVLHEEKKLEEALTLYQEAQQADPHSALYYIKEEEILSQLKCKNELSTLSFSIFLYKYILPWTTKINSFLQYYIEPNLQNNENMISNGLAKIPHLNSQRIEARIRKIIGSSLQAAYEESPGPKPINGTFDDKIVRKVAKFYIKSHIGFWQIPVATTSMPIEKPRMNTLKYKNFKI